MGFSGQVVNTGSDKDFGNFVKIKLADGNVVQLSHLDNIAVQPGQQVDQFQSIGTIGNTGHVIPSAG